MQLKHKMAMAVLAAFAMAASTAAGATPGTRPVPTPRSANQGFEATDDGGCNPFADWDYDDLTGADDTGARLAATSSSRGTQAAPRIEAVGAAARVIGGTPEEIHRRFVHVVTRNLANAGTASRVARLSDRELAAIARYAGQGAPTGRAELLKLFAMRLDAGSLVRVARAFGAAPVEAAVRAYADPARRAAFDSALVGFAPVPSGGGSGGSGGGSYPRPNLNMTLEEIYLEFRTAPVGSLSPSAALAETSMYAGGWLYASWTIGSAVGDGIYQIISTYDPDLDEALGGTIASMIENMWLATDAVEQGHYDAALDDLFGFPVTWSSNPWGDWDVSGAMVDYYNWSGTCGY